MQTEVELKYMPKTPKFDPMRLFCHPEIVRWRKELHTIQMHTRYLDTEDGECARRKLTVRQRIENGESIFYAKCTAQTDKELSHRMEWSVKSEDLATAAELLGAQGAPTYKFRHKPLIVTCELKFERMECRVKRREDFEYILCYDEGYFNGSTYFSEVEFELAKGTGEELARVARAIAEELELHPQTMSKHERALITK